MRWVTVATEQGPRVCGVVHERYVDLNGADPKLPSSMRELLGMAPDQQHQAWALLDHGALSYEPARARLLAPVPDPRKIICIGLNYRDHAAESGVPAPPEPVLFSKYSTSLIGHLDRIKLPRVSQEVDYEAELVIVIGRGENTSPRRRPVTMLAVTRSDTTCRRATGSSTSRPSNGWPARRSTRSLPRGQSWSPPMKCPTQRIWAFGCGSTVRRCKTPAPASSSSVSTP